MTTNKPAHATGALGGIEDYDALKVAEITLLLATLTTSELRAVRQQEMNGKGRVTLLRLIDLLLDTNSAGSAESHAAPTRTVACRNGHLLAEGQSFCGECWAEHDDLASNAPAAAAAGGWPSAAASPVSGSSTSGRFVGRTSTRQRILAGAIGLVLCVGVGSYGVVNGHQKAAAAAAATSAATAHKAQVAATADACVTTVFQFTKEVLDPSNGGWVAYIHRVQPDSSTIAIGAEAYDDVKHGHLPGTTLEQIADDVRLGIKAGCRTKAEGWGDSAAARAYHHPY